MENATSFILSLAGGMLVGAALWAAVWFVRTKFRITNATDRTRRRLEQVVLRAAERLGNAATEEFRAARDRAEQATAALTNATTTMGERVALLKAAADASKAATAATEAAVE